MADQDTLWDAVKIRYDASGLITLTNIRDRSATSIDDTAGTQAAASVIALWPAYAQVEFDATSALHLEVGAFAVIAVLWRRGGASSTIEQVKWDEVFGTEGMIQKVRRTDPRARSGPRSNSGILTSQEDGQSYGWSDPKSLPSGVLPSTTTRGSG